MYTSHFGLTEAPFSITPDPRYLYMSERHREALAHLLYGVGEGGGFVQLTGEVGTGKTTVCRCFLEQLPSHVDAALILNPKLTALELLATACDELGILYPAGTVSLKVLVDALYRCLLDAHGQGRRTLLIIDEAQDLSTDALEQVRLLTNLETTTEKLLQVILIGQPELIKLLERPKLRQLAQRVTARYHLTPLSKDETRAYIRHRLKVAGRDDVIFSTTAMRLVHRLSGGVPRLINVICDRALLGAYAQDRTRVRAATVRRAAAEVRRGSVRSPRVRRFLPVSAALVMAALVGAAIFLIPTWLNRIDEGATRGNGLSVPGHPSLVTDVRDTRRTLSLTSASDGERVPVKPVPPPVTDPLLSERVASADGAPAKSLRLGDVLADRSLRGDKPAAFAALYARWGLEFDDSRSELACERARLEKLECVFRTGAWKKLRRFNVPAIIELVTASGEQRYATVRALEKDQATIELGRQVFTFPLGEIDRFWEGAFIILWRPPVPGALPIVPGARGRPVTWLRQRLGEVGGMPVMGQPGDVYDDELKARVMAFQRARALVPDGVVGIETLTQLAAAAHEPGIPWLSDVP